MKRIFLLFAASMLLWACSSNEPGGGLGGAEAAANLMNITAEEQVVVDQQKDFALKFFELTYSGNNMIVSPLSASCNLSLLANAAEGKTRKEILDLLECQDITVLNSLNKKLLSNISKLDAKKVKVSLANSIWMNTDHNVSTTAEFKDIATKDYKAKVTSLALDKNAYKTVNSWAENETNGLITDFYKSDEVYNKVMIMMNALYFKGEFTNKFDKKKTIKSRFNALDGKVNDVYMMQDQRNLPYMNTDKAQAISLEFGSGVFDMIVALPNNGASLADAAAEAMSINTDKKESVRISIPKFKQEYMLPFKTIYQLLGINTMEANLSNILVNSNPLSCANFETKQKTVFMVDEDGAEGASVTGTEIDGFMPADAYFTADRPFVYMIREKTSGAILFIGAYVK